jgi:hypothetical protein
MQQQLFAPFYHVLVGRMITKLIRSAVLSLTEQAHQMHGQMALNKAS